MMNAWRQRALGAQLVAFVAVSGLGTTASAQSPVANVFGWSCWDRVGPESLPEIVCREASALAAEWSGLSESGFGENDTLVTNDGVTERILEPRAGDLIHSLDTKKPLELIRPFRPYCTSSTMRRDDPAFQELIRAELLRVAEGEDPKCIEEKSFLSQWLQADGSRSSVPDGGMPTCMQIRENPGMAQKGTKSAPKGVFIAIRDAEGREKYCRRDQLRAALGLERYQPDPRLKGLKEHLAYRAKKQKQKQKGAQELEICMALESTGGIVKEIHELKADASKLERVLRKQYPKGHFVDVVEFGQISKIRAKLRSPISRKRFGRLPLYFLEFDGEGTVEPVTNAINECLERFSVPGSARLVFVVSDGDADTLADSPSIDDLKARLKEKKAGLEIVDRRMVASLADGCVLDPDPRDCLVTLLKRDSREETREEVAELLGRTKVEVPGASAVLREVLRLATQEGTRWAVIRTIRSTQFEIEQSSGLLERALSDADREWTRRLVAQAIKDSRFEIHRSSDLLQRILRSTTADSTRQSVASAVGGARFAIDQSGPILKKILAESKTDQNRRAVARAISSSRFDIPEAPAILLSLLEASKSEDTKQQVARTIARCKFELSGSAEIVRHILGLVGDSDTSGFYLRSRRLNDARRRTVLEAITALRKGKVPPAEVDGILKDLERNVRDESVLAEIRKLVAERSKRRARAANR